MRSRAAGSVTILVVIASALIGAGCQGGVSRTSRQLLQRETSRTFARAFVDNHRMTSGRWQGSVIKDVSSQCRPLEANPRDDRDWHWTCRIEYRARSGERGAPTYRVAVDPRGCFSATTADVPPRVFEKVRDRRAPNPLAAFPGCP